MRTGSGQEELVENIENIKAWTGRMIRIRSSGSYQLHGVQGCERMGEHPTVNSGR